jgi:hypothetical protein
MIEDIIGLDINNKAPRTKVYWRNTTHNRNIEKTHTKNMWQGRVNSGGGSNIQKETKILRTRE